MSGTPVALCAPASSGRIVLFSEKQKSIRDLLFRRRTENTAQFKGDPAQLILPRLFFLWVMRSKHKVREK